MDAIEMPPLFLSDRGGLGARSIWLKGQVREMEKRHWTFYSHTTNCSDLL